MFGKIKKEAKSIRWPNKKTVLQDMKIVLITSAAMMLAMSLIEWVARLGLNLIF